MKKDGSTLARVAGAVGAALALWLAVVAYARMIAPDASRANPAESVDLSRKEIRRLSQFHGTNVIKIERDTVSILREGRWIPVSRGDRG
ncbi:MAG: hypothetical protein ACM3NF_08030 [Gemmatimonadota bacterium]